MIKYVDVIKNMTENVPKLDDLRYTETKNVVQKELLALGDKINDNNLNVNEAKEYLKTKLKSGVVNLGRADVAICIQTILKDKGHYNGNLDGRYGSKTKTAVIALQKALAFKSRKIDGVFGPETFAKYLGETDETYTATPSLHLAYIKEQVDKPRAEQRKMASQVKAARAAARAAAHTKASAEAGAEVSTTDPEIKTYDNPPTDTKPPVAPSPPAKTEETAGDTPKTGNTAGNTAEAEETAKETAEETETTKLEKAKTALKIFKVPEDQLEAEAGKLAKVPGIKIFDDQITLPGIVIHLDVIKRKGNFNLRSIMIKEDEIQIDLDDWGPGDTVIHIKKGTNLWYRAENSQDDNNAARSSRYVSITTPKPGPSDDHSAISKPNLNLLGNNFEDKHGAITQTLESYLSMESTTDEEALNYLKAYVLSLTTQAHVNNFMTIWENVSDQHHNLIKFLFEHAAKNLTEFKFNNRKIIDYFIDDYHESFMQPAKIINKETANALLKNALGFNTLSIGNTQFELNHQAMFKDCLTLVNPDHYLAKLKSELPEDTDKDINYLQTLLTTIDAKHVKSIAYIKHLISLKQTTIEANTETISREQALKILEKTEQACFTYNENPTLKGARAVIQLFSDNWVQELTEDQKNKATKLVASLKIEEYAFTLLGEDQVSKIRELYTRLFRPENKDEAQKSVDLIKSVLPEDEYNMYWAPDIGQILKYSEYKTVLTQNFNIQATPEEIETLMKIRGLNINTDTNTLTLPGIEINLTALGLAANKAPLHSYIINEDHLQFKLNDGVLNDTVIDLRLSDSKWIRSSDSHADDDKRGIVKVVTQEAAEPTTTPISSDPETPGDEAAAKEQDATEAESSKITLANAFDYFSPPVNEITKTKFQALFNESTSQEINEWVKGIKQNKVITITLFVELVLDPIKHKATGTLLLKKVLTNRNLKYYQIAKDACNGASCNSNPNNLMNIEEYIKFKKLDQCYLEPTAEDIAAFDIYSDINYGDKLSIGIAKNIVSHMKDEELITKIENRFFGRLYDANRYNMLHFLTDILDKSKHTNSMIKIIDRLESYHSNEEVDGKLISEHLQAYKKSTTPQSKTKAP